MRTRYKPPPRNTENHLFDVRFGSFPWPRPPLGRPREDGAQNEPDEAQTIRRPAHRALLPRRFRAAQRHPHQLPLGIAHLGAVNLAGGQAAKRGPAREAIVHLPEGDVRP